MAADLAADDLADTVDAAKPEGRYRGLRLTLLRLLYLFWATTLIGGAAGGIVLNRLGAPPVERAPSVDATAPSPTAPAPRVPDAPAPTPAAHAVADHATPPTPANVQPAPSPRQSASLPLVSPVPPPPVPRPREPGTIAPPDPLLLEPSSLYPGGRLPRLAADRRTPLQTYAAAFDTSDNRPRIAILLGGVGMSEAESLAAATLLPAQVSFAVSPYASRPDRVLEELRARGHEYLVSIPMEPQGYPLNDPGNRALLTGATLASNLQRLEWALTRFTGYVGATGALGDMRGERFAAATDQMAPVLDMLADRGLLYIDPRSNPTRLSAPPSQRGVSRPVDLVIDDPPGKTEIDARLARLEVIAKDRGSALGLAGRPSPVTIDRIATWASNLSNRGIALAPASVVVQMPVVSATAVRTNLLR